MSEHVLSILVKAIGAKTAAKDLKSVDSTIANIGNRAKAGVGAAAGNIARIGLVAAGGLGAMVKAGIDNLAELENATTKVDGAIKTMGQTGKVTAAQVAAWSNKIESDIGAAFDDKAITAATATLIRFGNVTPKNLNKAMVVMTDLAAKTGDVDSAASLLAKALADPTKAAGKLAKNGIVLTKVQQDNIKALVKAGKTEKAQAILLDLIATKTKGAAAATQGPYQRALSTLHDVTEDAQKALAEGFLPVLEKVAGFLKGKLADPKTLQDIRGFGVGLADAFDKVLNLAGKVPWDSIGGAMKLSGIAAKGILDAFTAMPPWVQTAIVTGWGLNKLTGGAVTGIIGAIGSGLIKGVLGMNAGVVNINAGVVNGGGGAGIPAVPAAGAAAAGGIGVGTAVAAAIPPTIIVAGLTDSLLKIQGFADQNAQYAKQGLTNNEILAQRYYTANKADQDRIFKLNFGRLPSKADFDTGNAKLISAAAASDGRLIHSAEVNGHQVTAATLSLRDKVESAKTAGVAAANRTTVAAAHAGHVAAAAIAGKKMSFTAILKTTLYANISTRQTSKVTGTVGKYQF